jgi:periplasmic protein TonB
MAFPKKRTSYFGVFSSYSLLVHVAGLLAILIFSASPPPQTSSPTVLVRLVDAPPPVKKTVPVRSVSTLTEFDQLATSQQDTTPHSTPTPVLFQVIPPEDIIVSSSTHNLAGTNQRSHSSAHVSVNALIPVSIAPTAPRIQRASQMTPYFTRTLLDQKAGSSLVTTRPPKVLYKQTPPYPKLARELGLEGKTLLRVEILQDGRPGMVKVRESCGYTVLDEAAAESIKEWKFAPAQDGLFAVRSVVDLPIRFSLQS